MNTRVDAEDVADYLIDYFNFLIGSYPEAFINNIEKTRKDSLINDNNMFVGYIVLARKMFEKGIKPRKVKEYIDNIEFNRENKLWQEKGILDSQLNITDTNKARKSIKELFENIDV
jgi:hypothetical protein